jgi:hypothetical protein
MRVRLGGMFGKVESKARCVLLLSFFLFFFFFDSLAIPQFPVFFFSFLPTDNFIFAG